ncbi:PQQ-binding-like beta-propeller repeat protein [Haloferax denitrificans]|uniref:outer membrane protein assembly factor BamB family protein n=1 Tax=Haloferax denitrificans TaxID=35745 RepID=UPI003C6EAC82
MRRRQVLASLGAAALAGCSTSNLGVPRAVNPLPGEDDASAWAQQGPTPANRRHAAHVSVTDPTEAWRVENDGPVSTPAVVGETVYLAAGVPDEGDRKYHIGALLAVDRETGTERWRTVFDSHGGGYAGCSPIVYDGTVYVGDAGRHGLYAVDARTGDVRWTADLGGSVNRPVVAADGVVCLAQQEYIVAFDTAGEEQWRYSKLNHTFLTTPTVVDGTVYVGSVFTGDESESVDDESSVVAALDLQTGEVVWEAARGENFATVSAADGRLYLAGKQTVQALDSADGSRVWSHRVDSRFGRLAVGDDAVFATDGRRAVALGRKDGGRRWEFEADTHLRTHPTVTGESVVVSTDNPRVDDHAVTYALDVDSGDPRWTLELDGKMGYAAAVGEDRVYLPSHQTGESGVVVGVESANPE